MIVAFWTQYCYNHNMNFVYFIWYLYIILYYLIISGHHDAWWSAYNIQSPEVISTEKKISIDAMSQAKEIWPSAQYLLSEVRWGLWKSQSWKIMTEDSINGLDSAVSGMQRNTHVLVPREPWEVQNRRARRGKHLSELSSLLLMAASYSWVPYKAQRTYQHAVLDRNVSFIL